MKQDKIFFYVTASFAALLSMSTPAQAACSVTAVATNAFNPHPTTYHYTCTGDVSGGIVFPSSVSPIPATSLAIVNNPLIADSRVYVNNLTQNINPGAGRAGIYTVNYASYNQGTDALIVEVAPTSSGIGNAISTYGTSAHGIVAQSWGNYYMNLGYLRQFTSGGYASGLTIRTVTNGRPLLIATNGLSAHGIFAVSAGGHGNGGDNSATGSGASGLPGGAGGQVFVDNTASINTYGNGSHGILGESIGGSGGNGGNGGLGGNGGAGGQGGAGRYVTLSNYGTITTSGVSSHAIAGRSLGGYGGTGGDGLFWNGGGVGGATSHGGTVRLNNYNFLQTTGRASYGMFAQSVGGFGGGGGGSYGFVGYAGGGNSAGNGGLAWANNYGGNIVTYGDFSHAIVAQSIGGGGGAGGNSGGYISVGGNGGYGGAGGFVSVLNQGSLTTYGGSSYGIFAQSIGGGGGDGGDSAGYGAIGGNGSGTSNGGTVDVTNSGQIVINRENGFAIFAQSVGGGGGNGGSTTSLSVGIGGSGGGGGNGGNVTVDNSGLLRTYQRNSTAILAQSVGGGGGNGGDSAGYGGLSLNIGGGGGNGGIAGDVTVKSDFALAPNSHSLVTSGVRSHGIHAQSIGGGGGNGGFAASFAGTPVASYAMAIGGHGGGGGASGVATVDNSSFVMTSGESSSAILAQSIGGGGGNGGFALAASISSAVTASASFGGSGGSGGAGNTVNVTNKGTLTTTGWRSSALVAQSIGGGGGDGGFAISGAAAGKASMTFAMGGEGGSGGNASNLFINNQGNILTTNHDSHGLLIQSIGGGGGNGGFALGASFSGGYALSGTIGGNGGAAGNGGAIANTANSGNIVTQGNDSHGILVQNIGGGGGNGGFSIGAAGSGTATANLALGGKGGSAGTAGTAYINNSGDVSTSGLNAKALLAQSIGGGGGNGGFSITANGSAGYSGQAGIGGVGLGGGNGGVANVHNAGILTTTNDNAAAIISQSIGGGGGNGGFSVGGNFAAYSGSFLMGGGASSGGSGGAADVTNTGGITTWGKNSFGILAQSIGGGGGNGGFVVNGTASSQFSGQMTLGGMGASGGSSWNTNVNNNADIITHGHESTAVLAQSIGGGGGNGGFSVTAGLSAGNAVQASIGGSGGVGGNAGLATISSVGNITTEGRLSHGLQAQSIGGGGGNGAFSIGMSGGRGHSGALSIGGSGGSGSRSALEARITSVGNILTKASGAMGIIAQSIGGGGGNGSFSLAGAVAGQNAITGSLGGSGGTGGNAGGAVVSSTGDIATLGENAYAILAQAIAGGGGNGGYSFTGSTALNANSLGFSFGGMGGGGGTVTAPVSVFSDGFVSTAGTSSHGIVGQSIGGGGGNGGFSGALTGTFKSGQNLSLAIGGAGGVGGSAGNVDITTQGTVMTSGWGSNAVTAQSIGGGGGNAGFGLNAALSAGNTGNAGTVTLGGSGGNGGNGGNVLVTNSAVIGTDKRYSYGILAQSIGGGGGNGGMALSGVIAHRSTGKQFSVGLGGSGGSGGSGGTVTVNNTNDISTSEADSTAILAQSIGGGGGNGGLSIAAGLTGSESTQFNLTLGGSGGNGSRSGDVSILQTANLQTAGNRSHGVMAQSIGGGGGNGGLTGAVSLGLGGSNSGYTGSIGGSGGIGNIGGNVSITNTGVIATYGMGAHAVIAQSIGGGGGNGGTALAATRTASAGQPNRNVAYSVAVGGSGGSGNHAGNITVSNDNVIYTDGDGSYGIYAQAIGGGGGSGGASNAFTMVKENEDNSTTQSKSRVLSVGGSGAASGDGGVIIVTNTGSITTIGADSHGILAQSIGGGGGAGGEAAHARPSLSDLIDLPEAPSFPSVPGFDFNPDPSIPDTQQDPGLNTDTKNLSITVGGSGGSSGNGKDITVNNTGDIRTYGAGAFGMLLQSIGGGGGIGGVGESGESGTVGVGGAGGSAGNGGNINVTFGGTLRTDGVGAHGIIVQSIGGGGGIGGNVDRGISEDNTTGLAFNRSGGAGGNGGDINIQTFGDIVTTGEGAAGIFAQSIGGGGGVVGTPTTAGVAFAGSTGAIGQGGNVTINHQGNIQTFGENSHGIFAQSLDGAGTPSGEINITYDGTISVLGDGAHAVLANATEGCGVACNINLDLQAGAVLTGGLNDATISLVNGRQNTVTNHGVIQSLNGLNGFAFEGTNGADAITNNNAVFGNLNLGGGVNAFNNALGATFVSGDVLNISGALDNAGLLNIGNSANILQAALTGNFVQQASGVSVFDIDMDTFAGDKIDVSGTANLDGTLNLNLLNIGLLKPGTRTHDLIDAVGGLVDAGAVLDVAPSRIIDYALQTGSGNKAVLRSTVDFTPADLWLNGNQSAIGEYFNNILTTSAAAFKTATEVIAGLQTDEEIANFYQQLTPEAQAIVRSTGILSAAVFGQRLRSCHQQSGTNKFIREGECWWSAFGLRITNRDTTASAMGYEARSHDMAGGMQMQISDNTHVGMGISIERSFSDTKDGRGGQDGTGFMIGSILKRQYDDVFVTGTLSGGLEWYDATRLVQTGPATFATAVSDYHTGFVSADVDVSRTYQRGNAYIRPLVGANLSYSWSSSFNETGAGALNVQAAHSDDIALSARLGIALGAEVQDYVTDCIKDCPVIRPFVSLSGVKYLTGEDTKMEARFEGSATSDSFRVSSPTYQDYLDFQTGFEVIEADNKVLRLNYGTKFSKDSIQHSIFAKLSIPF